MVLTYAKARFYDNDLGLFTSTDRLLGDLDTPPSLHRYLYANANPLTFIDPTGLMSEEQDNGGLLGSFAQGAADFFSGVADVAAFGYDHFAEGHALESLGQMMEGVGEAGLEFIDEINYMAEDLGRATYSMAKYQFTGEFESFEMRSQIGRAAEGGASTTDLLKSAVKGIVQVPVDYGKALMSGDPKQIGRATFNLEFLLVGGRGSAINPRTVVSGIRSQAAKLRTTPKVILEGSRKIGTKAVEVTAKVSERAKQGLRIAKTFTRDFSSRFGRRGSSRQQPRVETVESLVADFQSKAAEIVARRQAELPSNPSFGGAAFPNYQGFGLAHKKSGVPGDDFVPNPNVTQSYKRPSGAGPTTAQKAHVQGKPCVDCGEITPKQIADHRDPLVVQHYREGSVNIPEQRKTSAVQPHCPECSNVQGGQLSAFSRKMKKLLGLR